MEVIKKRVVILKALEGTDNTDHYETKFSEAGLYATIISPLEFEFCNLDVLKKKLLDPQSYSGIVFTSPRSVKGVSLSLQKESLPLAWNSCPAFVVGEATQQSVNSLLGFTTEGKECGSSKELADKISTREFDKPLLFPCGNLKTDTLTHSLKEKGISVEDVTVYRTCQSCKLEENLKEVVSEGFPEFIIFCSPSGVKFTVPLLLKFSVPWKDIKVISIGPSTEAALNEHGITVWAVSKKPNPDCLVEAVQYAPPEKS